ncbi:FAD-dependent oxidoreductase [Gilvibacter sp.]|uniref:NAD(P)/FAD-dependent oxidoreductase n=1 Tax=Gilvibacter sp. TaxID=2729997 RepID=UPI0025C28073|nr:FAD-dependent oxidoreductase [Gilvibacter sp.]NQX77382.1 FAD-binding oxidoreductase [Gilvibacter sp.]
MKTEVDYIVVGLGLAGINFVEKLQQTGKSFIVFDTGENYSSWVSGGLYNPVILKRLTLSWNAADQLERALPVYERIEKRLGKSFDLRIPVHKKFQSYEDLNNWVVACDKPHLKPYLNPTTISEAPQGVKVPFGMGQVLNTGKIDTSALMQAYAEDLFDRGLLFKERLDYDQLELDSGVNYKGITAKRIVFAEGFGLKQNPFFDSSKLKGNKGELLIIDVPDLKLDFVLKTDVFIIPLGGTRFSVGATYNWEDKTLEPTKEGRQKLLKALEKLIDLDYQVLEHRVGIRPTTADRRPLVGVHPKYTQMALLNGLGTRGVMIGPTVAHQLYEHLENGESLPQEIDIKRFYRN